jgi:exodeoxyribonuclease VII small subunit
MAKSKGPTFKEAFEQMEEISQQLESADLDVEAGMKLVARATKLHKLLQKKLKEAKLVISEK